MSVRGGQIQSLVVRHIIVHIRCTQNTDSNIAFSKHRKVRGGHIQTSQISRHRHVWGMPHKHKHQKIDTNVLDQAHKKTCCSNTERPVSTDRRTAPWVARAELNRDYVGISLRIATSMGCIGCAARQSTNSFRPVWQSRQFLPIQCCQAGPRPAGRSRRT